MKLLALVSNRTVLSRVFQLWLLLFGPINVTADQEILANAPDHGHINNPENFIDPLQYSGMEKAAWAEETPDPSHWGFVGYLTCDEKDREQVKEKLLKIARKPLEETAEVDSDFDPDNARAGAVIEWQDGESNIKSFDEVVKHYLDNFFLKSTLGEGIVIHGCILVDSDSARSILTNSEDPKSPPFVWVIDGAYDPEEEYEEEQEYTGKFKVRARHIFNMFYKDVFQTFSFDSRAPYVTEGQEFYDPTG